MRATTVVTPLTWGVYVSDGSATLTRARMPGGRQRSVTATLRLRNSGEVQADGRAVSQGAFGFGPPAVGLHEMLDDREPEPRTPLMTRAPVVDAVEPLEDSRQVLGGNAAPRVGHGNRDAVGHDLGGDANGAAGARVA